MKKLLLVLLLLTGFAVAQDGPTIHFTVEASAVGFSGGNQTSAATVTGGAVNLTKRFALGYEQVVLPALAANYHFGTINYTLPLTFGKKINSALVFDRKPWSTTFFGGAGVIRQDITGAMQQHVATTLGLGLNYQAGSHVTLNVVRGEWLHANVVGPAANQFVGSPNAAQVSSGLGLTF